MSATSCCQSLPHRITRSSCLSPLVSRSRASLLIVRSRTSRVFVDSLYLKLPNTRWRCSCFRQEDISSELSKSDFVKDKQPEESANSKFDHSKILKGDWISNFKKVKDAVFSAERWTVPWKARTILQVKDAVFSAERWTVPWKARTILQVMLLWIASFWLIGSWIIPFLAYMGGFRKESLTYRGQALYSLVTEVAEGVFGFAVLNRCLARFQPLPSDWFRCSLKGKWHFDVGLACTLFPLVNRLSQVNLNLLPILPSTPVNVSNIEQSIVARDPVAMALYAVVVSVCAPIWEEIVFRGFLLPSLTRYMPVWCSILVSAVAFAFAHFNVQRLLPLVFLGMMMGAIFARSRNLFAPILLHSLWNAFVFLDLMK